MRHFQASRSPGGTTSTQPGDELPPPQPPVLLLHSPHEARHQPLSFIHGCAHCPQSSCCLHVYVPAREDKHKVHISFW